MPIKVGEDNEEGEVPDDQSRPSEAVDQPPTAKRSRASAASSLDALGGGSVYIPPAKRRMLEKLAREEQEKKAEAGGAEAEDEEETKKRSVLEQRKSWEEEKRVVHGTINRLNEETIKPLIHDLFDKVNLIRLRGVLAKSILQAAVSSPRYSNVYAALLSVINSKLPEVGELVVQRAILAFRRHYRRREKQSCLATAIFLAHLFHQQMVHELLILQILSLLLDGDPTDDSVEIAVQLLTVSGNALLEVSSAGVRAVLERLRALLHEGNLNKRVEYKMEKLLALRKTGFRDYPPVPEDLDLVESDDQITFEISLDDEDIKKEDSLDVFHVDPKFEETEQEWKTIRAEILGLGDDDSDGSGDSETESSESDGSNDEDDEEAGEGENEGAMVAAPAAGTNTTVQIRDLSEADLVHLRRSIYLTIMSSATFEECTHKLAKIDIPEGREEELINMLIECCSQERTFLRYYGLISSRFCLLDDRWRDAFMDAFAQQYNTIHRLETNKLRNVAKLFAHLLHTDAMPWSVMNVIHLNEDETTSSSRIFVKILIQEMAEAMGINKLKSRFDTTDPEHIEWYKGMFPKDNMRSTRYAINFFTSIGLGPLTDGLREHLKNAPKLILEQAKQEALAKANKDDDDSSVSSSSSSSSSDSSSLSSSSSSSSGSRSYSSSSSSSYSRRRRSSRGRRSRRSPSSSSSSSDDSRSRSRSYSSSSSRSRSSSRSVEKTSKGRSRPVERNSTDARRDSRRRGRRLRSYSRSRSQSRSSSPPRRISGRKSRVSRSRSRSRSRSN